jgi:hypothetical protein
MKFPGNDIWRDEQWYANIRAALELLINKERMLNGLSCSDKAFPLCRNHIEEICKWVYEQNNPSHLVFLLQLTMNRQAIGRANEAITSTFDKFFYDASTHAVTTDWSQLKTGVQDLMSFFNDKDCFEIDPLQALANYIIRSDQCVQTSEDITRIFRKDTAEISSMFKKIKDDVGCLKSISDKVSSLYLHNLNLSLLFISLSMQQVFVLDLPMKQQRIPLCNYMISLQGVVGTWYFCAKYLNISFTKRA